MGNNYLSTPKEQIMRNLKEMGISKEKANEIYQKEVKISSKERNEILIKELKQKEKKIQKLIKEGV